MKKLSIIALILITGFIGLFAESSTESEIIDLLKNSIQSTERMCQRLPYTEKRDHDISEVKLMINRTAQMIFKYKDIIQERKNTILQRIIQLSTILDSYKNMTVNYININDDADDIDDIETSYIEDYNAEIKSISNSISTTFDEQCELLKEAEKELKRCIEIEQEFAKSLSPCSLQMTELSQTVTKK